MSKEEIWKPIKGFEKNNQISNLGNGWSNKLNRQMIPAKQGKYMTYKLGDNCVLYAAYNCNISVGDNCIIHTWSRNVFKVGDNCIIKYMDKIFKPIPNQKFTIDGDLNVVYDNPLVDIKYKKENNE